MKDKEIWRDVIGYEGYYQVSNHGRMKSLKRKGVSKEMIMALHNEKTGYHSIFLSKNSKKIRKLIHRLVAEAFIENPLNKKVVNHLDHDKKNNYISNLQWCTTRENVMHTINSGRKTPKGPRGENNYHAKLNQLQVRIIIRLKGDVTGTYLARLFSVTHTTIYKIWNNKSWQYI